MEGRTLVRCCNISRCAVKLHRRKKWVGCDYGFMVLTCSVSFDAINGCKHFKRGNNISQQLSTSEHFMLASGEKDALASKRFVILINFEDGCFFIAVIGVYGLSNRTIKFDEID